MTSPEELARLNAYRKSGGQFGERPMNASPVTLSALALSRVTFTDTDTYARELAGEQPFIAAEFRRVGVSDAEPWSVARGVTAPEEASLIGTVMNCRGHYTLTPECIADADRPVTAEELRDMLGPHHEQVLNLVFNARHAQVGNDMLNEDPALMPQYAQHAYDFGLRARFAGSAPGLATAAATVAMQDDLTDEQFAARTEGYEALL